MSKQENNTNAAKNEVDSKSNESLCELLKNILLGREYDKSESRSEDKLPQLS